MSGIWVVAEQRDNVLKKISYELLGQGRKLADSFGEELNVILLGNGVSSLEETVKNHGADKIFTANSLTLAEYNTEEYTSVISKLLLSANPRAVLLGHTAIGKDLAPRLAEILGTGLIEDCIDISFEGGEAIFVRPVYAGKAFSKSRFTNNGTIMATIRPNVFPQSNAGNSAKGIVIAVDTGAESLKSLIRETVKRISGRVELTEADIIVSGGRGMKGPENFSLLEELADATGAAVGASRAAVDSGWKEQQYQVGQTGKTVTPTLYIACGISGAIQHLAGMSSSKYIIAINKDPDANIFKVADYGILGDLFKVVPLLTEEIKKMKV